ncbi:DUF4386 domain-containing protein [Aquiluna borgnonia]|uniref:DUF4386 domain-containing protein n=1 Tax=Aquiluna borgnonia TaxID=2499157 RepID=A0A7D4TJG7_9MICO|nr:DUF4386 family protein [Aquiluna borgnonia]QKJ25651.1 DUF4386 domain-containing protein [Aquiluna borgnonia]
MLTLVVGLLLIFVPILFNWTFASLAKQFEYPEILRQPTEIVLAIFRAGGSRLVKTWWLFAMSALLFGLVAVLVAFILEIETWLIALIASLGLLASLTQFLGLVRWPFMVPHLAREAENADDQKLQTIDLIFQSFNRYLGVAVGEHLGYLFTGIWTATLGGALITLNSETHFGWYLASGIAGVLIGLLLVLCSFEFVGKNEPDGWSLAGAITPFVYVAWSLWLVVLGVSILIGEIAG